GPDRGIRLGGDIDQPSVFVRKSSQPIAQASRLTVQRSLPSAIEGRDRVRNGVVEAPVQRTKLVHRNARILLDRYLGDGLANIAIFVDNLINAVPEAQQFRAVQRGGTP